MGSWKEKSEFSLNKTYLEPDEAIKQSYYTRNKTLPENSSKYFLIHELTIWAMLDMMPIVKEDQRNSE